MTESVYSKEFQGLLDQYNFMGYVVLDDELINEIKVLNGRYQV